MGQHYKYIIFIILFQPIKTFGQLTNNGTNQISSRYNDIKYEIINIDTIITNYVRGDYNAPNFKRWDSTKILADIILINLPIKLDSVKLRTKVKEIMKNKGINKAYVFRDKYSSLLFRLSSTYAAKILKQKNGYVGQIDVD